MLYTSVFVDAVENTTKISDFLSKKIRHFKIKSGPEAKFMLEPIILWLYNLPLYISFNLSPSLWNYDDYEAVSECSSNCTHKYPRMRPKCENVQDGLYIGM